MNTLKEIWQYLRERKKWWFLPVLLALALVGVFIWLSSSGIVGPFIYTLF